jgi:hypothetical protein
LTLSESDELVLKATKMKDAEVPQPLSLELKSVKLPGIFDEDGEAVTSAAVAVVSPDIESIVKQGSKAAINTFVAKCIEVADPCSKTEIIQRANDILGLSEAASEKLLEQAIKQTKVHRVGEYKASKYIAHREGLSGEKSIEVAAMLLENEVIEPKIIAEKVGVSRQYVTNIRRQILKLA